MLRAYLLFVIAGLAEIGGGYLVWLWLRNGKSVWMGILGGVILFVYGVIATRQEFLSFGKVYAAYGGVFIVMSVLWGWLVSKNTPSVWEFLGAAICVLGVTVMLAGSK